jgi:putative multiple sugar transport system substrate-binding protein
MNLKTLAAAAAIGLLTAASVAQAQDKGTIGIAMPTKTSARWIADGDIW